MSNKNAPIGVFDSGLGGLTVAREIMRQMPKEKMVYFGDTAGALRKQIKRNGDKVFQTDHALFADPGGQGNRSSM